MYSLSRYCRYELESSRYQRRLQTYVYMLQTQLLEPRGPSSNSRLQPCPTGAAVSPNAVLQSAWKALQRQPLAAMQWTFNVCIPPVFVMSRMQVLNVWSETPRSVASGPSQHLTAA
jgi:hypothetical protein